MVQAEGLESRWATISFGRLSPQWSELTQVAVPAGLARPSAPAGDLAAEPALECPPGAPVRGVVTTLRPGDRDPVSTAGADTRVPRWAANPGRVLAHLWKIS